MITIAATEIAFILGHAFLTYPGKKIEQIKFVRSVTGLGLKMSKDLVEAEHERRNPADAFAVIIERIVRPEPKWPDMGTRGLY